MYPVKSKQDLKGFNECIGVTRILMRWVGTWPGLYKERKFLDYFLGTMSVLLSIFLMILPQSRKLAQDRQDFNAILEILSLGIVITFICLLKFAGLMYCQKDMKKLISNIQEDWLASSREEQLVMWKNARLSKLIVLLCVSSPCWNITLLVFRVFIMIYNNKIDNLSDNATFVKPLVLKSDFPFDIQPSPLYEIFLLAQAVACYTAAIVYASYDGFFVAAILHYSGQLYNLQIYVKNLTSECLRRNCSFKSLLVPVIYRHRHLCRYINMVEENFNKIFLIQVLAMTILMCLQGYQFVLNISAFSIELLPDILFSIFYVLGSLINLFVYCFVAEQLRRQSENLFQSIFKMDWYELSRKESNLLIVFMSKTINPIEITVGKFSTFSYQYFCSIVNTSGGYLSMLLAVRSRLQLEN